MLRLLFAASAAALFFFAPPSAALEPPSGKPILTISGDIGAANDGDAAQFDRGMLEALEWREIESYTDFTRGLDRFAGVPLTSLLEAVGVESGILIAVALDDYTIEIPVSDAEEFDVLVALERNGKPMRIREKGPMWVIYPAASRDEINEVHSSRMIWQLRHITVRR